MVKACFLLKSQEKNFLQDKMMIQDCTSKYDGLRKIEAYCLPHPEWLFIKSPQDIPKKPWVEAPHGWTIRCCPLERYEFGLPSEHRLKYEELPKVLHMISQKVNVSDFVVYPSWEFDISGCLLIGPDEIVVEVVVGDIAPLLKGQKTPDAIYSYKGSGDLSLMLIAGEKELLSASDKIILIDAVRQTPFTKYTTVLEWTKTTMGRILFHDLIELSKSP
jgi:hypothetical protein